MTAIWTGRGFLLVTDDVDRAIWDGRGFFVMEDAGGGVSEQTFSHTIFISPIVSIDSKLQESFIQTIIY